MLAPLFFVLTQKEEGEGIVRAHGNIGNNMNKASVAEAVDGSPHLEEPTLALIEQEVGSTPFKFLRI